MLRKGKTKNMLESSIESALTAVQVYNNPLAKFRTENYITLMIIAWTRLLHSHFYHTIGDKYYYKDSGSNRYCMVDGERKAWDLTTCIKKYGKLSNSIVKNIEFFIRIRNKIEHRHIDKNDLGEMIFGECQSLLYNFESTLIDFFLERNMQ